MGRQQHNRQRYRRNAQCWLDTTIGASVIRHLRETGDPFMTIARVIRDHFVKLYMSIPKHKRFASADEAADYWNGLTSESTQRSMGYKVGWDKGGEDEDLVERYKSAVEEMKKNQTQEEKMIARQMQLEGERLIELNYPKEGLSDADSRAIIDTLKAEGYTLPD